MIKGVSLAPLNEERFKGASIFGHQIRGEINGPLQKASTQDLGSKSRPFNSIKIQAKGALYLVPLD